MSEKNKKKITISLIVVIAVALIWFLIISPLIEFKKSEKEVLNAGKRYFEVNKTKCKELFEIIKQYYSVFQIESNNQSETLLEKIKRTNRYGV